MQPGTGEHLAVVVDQVDADLCAHHRGFSESEHDRIGRLPHREGHLIGSGERRFELDGAHEFGVGRSCHHGAGIGTGGEGVQAGAALAEAIAHLDLVEGGEVAERAHAEPDEQTGELFVSQHTHGERGEEILRETCRNDGARGASSGGELCRERAVGDADAHLGEARLGEDIDEGPPCFGFAVVVAGDAPCCLLYTSPSPRDVEESRMPSSA